MQLNNRTPFEAQHVFAPNEQGIDTLYSVVKATFIVGEKWTLQEEQLSPQLEDEYFDDPNNSSLKYATDFHIGKPCSDIVIMGEACALEMKPVTYLDVGVAVGVVQKVIRVFGNRYWQNGFASKPEVFESIPLIYENAYGGKYIVDDELKSLERRNPIGRGYRGRRSIKEMDGQSLPNIEDPSQLITDISDTPTPAGFGFCAPHWLPRAECSGTYDEHWQKTRAPYLPQDFNTRFNNSAHPDLQYSGFLKGGEKVKIVNMHPGGAINLILPEIKLKGQLRVVRQHDQDLEFKMETLVIEPKEKRVQMVWKASYVANNNVSKIREVNVSLIR